MQIFNCDEDDKFSSLKEQYELTLLYDYYSGLLKESKREILCDYYFNDMSLSEIAEDKGISRQGVYDTVKRCTKSLMEYEEILGLAKKHKQVKKSIKEIVKKLDNIEDNDILDIKNSLNEIIDTI